MISSFIQFNIFKQIYKTTQPTDDWKPVLDSTSSESNDFEIKITSYNQHINLAFDNVQVEKL